MPLPIKVSITEGPNRRKGQRKPKLLLSWKAVSELRPWAPGSWTFGLWRSYQQPPLLQAFGLRGKWVPVSPVPQWHYCGTSAKGLNTPSWSCFSGEA